MNITSTAKTMAVDDFPDMTIPAIKKTQKKERTKRLARREYLSLKSATKEPFFLISFSK